jgi:hypothetical protein
MIDDDQRRLGRLEDQIADLRGSLILAFKGIHELMDIAKGVHPSQMKPLYPIEPFDLMAPSS